jgi:site-specific recombinase XerD
VAESTTGRIRRCESRAPGDQEFEAILTGSKFRHAVLVPASPAPTIPPGPHGDLSRASTDQLVTLTREVWPAASTSVGNRCLAVRRFLSHMETLPGETWQERWDASDLAAGTRRLGRKGTDQIASYRASVGMKLMFCLRVIRPTLLAFRSHTIHHYADLFRVAQSDPQLDSFYERVSAVEASRFVRLGGVFDIACALTVFGIKFKELTPEALLHYAWECRRHDVTYTSHLGRNTFGGLLAWQVLHAMGHFPPGTPQSIRAASVRGRLTVEEMVDRHPIANRAVRQLLIDYLQRRAGELDYSTMEGLAARLAGTFWAKIEQIAPGQADLRLDQQVYEQWRASIRLREDGRPRVQGDEILLSVRSLYLDIHTWAAAEPERWASWVAPCPILATELAGSGRRQRRIRERSAARTRVRQPLLPLLIADVEDHYAHMHQLLGLARDAAPDQIIAVDGRAYRRLLTPEDQRLLSVDGHPRVRVQAEATGEVINLLRAEETAFWEWAIVQTLRHTGVRIEELLELTQLSIRQYQRPNGEVIALLVIAPSKTDRERVIPMSADLFHVLAAVIRRHTMGGRTVPLVTRYDGGERLHSALMPFLFQRQVGSTRSVFTHNAVVAMLGRRCTRLAERHPSFGEARFTPHDFRRIFATDLVNNGLPIHIGAALLGHLNLETTRGYVAVFEEDLVRHYQAFLDRRRSVRPSEEYRPATDVEWREFQRHFDKRKVELGSCGRPYGTPCVHEHACVRCPMLHVSPTMIGRLDDLEADLIARRSRAHQEGWLGEIEGLDLTLSHLRGKRDQTRRLARASGLVELDLQHDKRRSR